MVRGLASGEARRGLARESMTYAFRRFCTLPRVMLERRVKPLPSVLAPLNFLPFFSAIPFFVAMDVSSRFKFY